PGAPAAHAGDAITKLATASTAMPRATHPMCRGNAGSPVVPVRLRLKGSETINACAGILPADIFFAPNPMARLPQLTCVSAVFFRSILMVPPYSFASRSPAWVARIHMATASVLAVTEPNEQMLLNY